MQRVYSKFLAPCGQSRASSALVCCSMMQEVYSKFLAIGLFRLLELSGAKDPKALEGLVTSLNVRVVAVNRDLLTYKVRMDRINYKLPHSGVENVRVDGHR